MEIVKQEVEHLNGAVVGGNELKWPGMDHVPSSNCKVLYSRNDKLRRNGVASLLRQDAVQVVRGYNARSDQLILTASCLCSQLQRLKKMKLKALMHVSEKKLTTHTQTRHADNYR